MRVELRHPVAEAQDVFEELLHLDLHPRLFADARVAHENLDDPTARDNSDADTITMAGAVRLLDDVVEMLGEVGIDRLGGTNMIAMSCVSPGMKGTDALHMDQDVVAHPRAGAERASSPLASRYSR